MYLYIYIYIIEPGSGIFLKQWGWQERLFVKLNPGAVSSNGRCVIFRGLPETSAWQVGTDKIFR